MARRAVCIVKGPMVDRCGVVCAWVYLPLTCRSSAPMPASTPNRVFVAPVGDATRVDAVTGPTRGLMDARCVLSTLYLAVRLRTCATVVVTCSWAAEHESLIGNSADQTSGHSRPVKDDATGLVATLLHVRGAYERQER